MDTKDVRYGYPVTIISVGWVRRWSVKGRRTRRRERQTRPAALIHRLEMLVLQR